MPLQEICELQEIPEGGMKTVTVEGTELLVLHGTERVLVVPPSCPHMRSHLCDGIFDGAVLTCLTHLWQWSIEQNGAPIGLAERPLLVYETAVVDGKIWADVSKELVYDYETDEV